MDVNRVHVGQPVEVTGEAFPGISLKGRIAWVAPQATVDSGSTAAYFPVRVEPPPLTDAQRSRIRVGMSANLAVTVYEAEQSVVVPPEAVRQTPGGTVVRLRDAVTGIEKDVPVTIGETTESVLEIRDGVRPGDRVVVR